jgi:hypothetical protein
MDLRLLEEVTVPGLGSIEVGESAVEVVWIVAEEVVWWSDVPGGCGSVEVLVFVERGEECEGGAVGLVGDGELEVQDALDVGRDLLGRGVEGHAGSNHVWIRIEDALVVGLGDDAYPDARG